MSNCWKCRCGTGCNEFKAQTMRLHHLLDSCTGPVYRIYFIATESKIKHILVLPQSKRWSPCGLVNGWPNQQSYQADNSTWSTGWNDRTTWKCCQLMDNLGMHVAFWSKHLEMKLVLFQLNFLHHSELAVIICATSYDRLRTIFH